MQNVKLRHVNNCYSVVANTLYRQSVHCFCSVAIRAKKYREKIENNKYSGKSIAKEKERERKYTQSTLHTAYENVRIANVSSKCMMFSS